MTKLVILSLGQGNLESGFPNVSARMWMSGNSCPMQVSGSLPAAPEIAECYRRWRILYEELYQRLFWRIRSPNKDFEIDLSDVTNISEVEFSELCQQLKTLLNTWLNSAEFRPIDRQLRQKLNQRDEIRIIVETKDNQLRQIPWQLWNFLEDYRKAEIALGTVNFEPPPYRTPAGKVRILAIFGNSDGIDIEIDRKLLEKLPGAELVCLNQPRRREFNRYLWDRQGWDILFFAGHSQTEGETGWIDLNQDERLTITQFNNALRNAIQRGLQLAIFNSCDGLGLANQLADMQIPQTIVMREPVSDEVATAFLENFLEAFAGGDSFYLAVREAREKLEQLEDEFVCATWLPVICQNPAVEPPTWQQLRGIDSLTFQTVLIVSVAVTILLLVLRQMGMFQLWEWQTFDQMLRWRPDEGIDSRLLVIEATEEEINRYGFPLPDGVIAQVVDQLKPHQPRIIGLDIFRDRATSGHAALAKHFEQNQHFIGLCSAKQANNPNKPGISPPSSLPKSRLGFSDVVVDPDGIIRRHLLFMQPLRSDPCATEHSFSARVALQYLAKEGIQPRNLSGDRIQLGEAILTPLEANAGAYQQVDVRGFQLLLNYRKQVARRVKITEVLSGRVNPAWVKNRIVLIGMNAAISADDFSTPYSTSDWPYQKMPGVLVQAQMVSQILSAVLDERPLLWVWNWWGEMFWIWCWSMVGGLIAWKIRRLPDLTLAAAVAVGVLYGVCFVVLTQGGWVPLVPSSLALVMTGGSAIAKRAGGISLT
jgi:CHASE2 domain-containing sensor protein